MAPLHRVNGKAFKSNADDQQEQWYPVSYFTSDQAKTTFTKLSANKQLEKMDQQVYNLAYNSAEYFSGK